MLDGARIVVVVPAHNEALLIGAVLRAMPSFVDRIVVVDDASADGTASCVRDLNDSRTLLIEHAQNRGVGAAIASGYRAALQDGADVVAVMAGDNQMDPADLPAVLGPVLRGQADYAKGDRLHHPEARRMPLERRIGTRVLGTVTRLALGLPSLSDSQCGYTAISAAALRGIDLDGLWHGFGYPNDLLGALRAAGFKSTDVIVRPVYRQEKSDLRTRHVLVILGVIARAAWRVRCHRTPPQTP